VDHANQERLISMGDERVLPVDPESLPHRDPEDRGQDCVSPSPFETEAVPQPTTRVTTRELVSTNSRWRGSSSRVRPRTRTVVQQENKDGNQRILDKAAAS
jgi:hypothetical protein